MLRDDPIVLKYPQYLPTETEVGQAKALLDLPEYSKLRDFMKEHIQIGGSVEASLWRFCWQAREDGKIGQGCSEGAIDWINRCVERRKHLGMNSILSRGHALFTPSFRERYAAAFPFSFHGTDKQGHPVYIARYGSMDVAALKKVWKEGEKLQASGGLAVNGAILYHLRAMEYLTQVVMAAESIRQGRVVDRMTAIVDLAGASMRLWAPEVKALVAGVAAESTPLFPETLHRMIIANVPWVLSKALWPVAKKFMHPVTQAKISMTSTGELKSTLLAVIDHDGLPPFLGGGCNCEECQVGRLQGGSLCLWEAELDLAPADADCLPDQLQASREVPQRTGANTEQTDRHFLDICLPQGASSFVDSLLSCVGRRRLSDEAKLKRELSSQTPDAPPRILGSTASLSSGIELSSELSYCDEKKNHLLPSCNQDRGSTSGIVSILFGISLVVTVIAVFAALLTQSSINWSLSKNIKFESFFEQLSGS